MKPALVIGGGVAGIQAALDLANGGIPVILVEREPSIGGRMAQLDKTFPTNDCSMCILSPKMTEAGRHPDITIYTLSEVSSLSGEAGNFTATILRHPRYVDEEKCNGCGDCAGICPVEVYNSFDAGIGVRKAIYRPHSQAVPDKFVRDPEHCIDCGLCYDVCGPGAILHDDEDTEKEITVNVSSIVVATGYNTFNPSKKRNLRYITIPDVITSLEFERMINASGPTGGKIVRLSNGERPGRVVFVQCVGSRDNSIERPYCSGVCCMQAIKNSTLLREKYPDMEVCICYIDIRAYGKGYDEYFERAKEKGVIFLRGLPGEIIQGDERLEMQVENTETGELIILEPELAVLSVGMEPSTGAAELAGILGIELDENGFFSSAEPKTGPVLTAREGIYIAGAAHAPRDIPDSVAMGQAAAMRASIVALRNRS